MLSKEKINDLFAEAYKNAVYAGVNMREITEILENIRSFFSAQKDFYDITKETDKYLAELLEKDKPFDIVAAFKKKYTHQVIQQIKTDIRKLSSGHEEEGMEYWLQHVGQALSKLKTAVYQSLLEEKIPVPEKYKSEYKIIKSSAPLIARERWAEGYSLYTHLATLPVLSDAVRATCWIVAGQIQLYHLLNYSMAKAHFENAKSLNPDKAQTERAFAEYYIVKKEFEKAREYIQKSMDLDNENYENFFLLGSLYKAENKHQIAERWFTDGLKVKYGKAEILNQLILLNENKEYFQNNAQNIDGLLSKISRLEPEFSYTALNNAGIVYQNNGDFAKAVHYFHKAKSMEPERIQAYTNLGYLYLEYDSPDKAYKTFSSMISRFPESFDGYWGLVFYYKKIKQWQRVIEELKKCKQLRPLWDKYIFREWGFAYEMLNKLQLAKSYYFKALESDPEKEIALNDLYELIRLYSKKDIQKALSILEEIRKIKGKSFDEKFYAERATLYYRHQEYEAAIQDFQKAIKINPKNVVYYSNVGLSLKKLKKWKEAEKAYKKALKLDPTNDLNWNDLGLLAYEQGADEKAIEYYQKAIEINPKYAVYHSNVGLSLKKLKRWEEAEAAFRKATALDPTNDLNWNDLGLLAYEQGADEKAIEYYQKAIEINPENPIYHSNVGLALKYLGKRKEAEKAYKKALELDPNNDLNWNYLGLLAYEQKEDEKAIEYYQKAIEINPENPVYHSNAGLALEYLGRWEEAEKAYKKALELDPNNDRSPIA